MQSKQHVSSFLEPSPPSAEKVSIRPTVGIVSQSAIADDPRVRRQGDALTDAGWNVIAVGLSGARASPPDWPILTTDQVDRLSQPPSMPATGYRSAGWRGMAIRAIKFGKYLGLRPYDGRLLSVSIDPGQAETVYWTLNSVLWELLALGSSIRADLWLGNDWTSLPIVARLAREQGVPFVYDTHELAADEFNESRRWRYLERPIRIAVEGQFIRRAAAVTTVSEGIARHLQKLYDLDIRPFAVRSTPKFQQVERRPVGNRIHVLYHGAVWPHRGLEASIRSVALWRPEFDLTIRGPMSDSYREILDREIELTGVQGRVHLVPPVPMTELVREAAAFDIGLFALPGHSRHNELALPNKFFEYTMAGLALCISDLPEMTHLLHRYDLGRVIPTVEPESIAQTVNSFDRDSITTYSKNALNAALELNWEREREKMIACYCNVIGLFKRAAS